MKRSASSAYSRVEARRSPSRRQGNPERIIRHPVAGRNVRCTETDTLLYPSPGPDTESGLRNACVRVDVIGWRWTAWFVARLVNGFPAHVMTGVRIMNRR